MSSKTVKFDEASLAQQFQDDDEAVEGRLKKGKHSLDSDEEDDEGDKYDVMKEDDIEGQEERTIDFDDDIQITPFNMREEMEEGHFDKDGTFIFDKSKAAIKDNWIDNIDWVRVKESERTKFQEQAEAAAADEELPPVDKISLFQEMLEILQPQETVAKAVRRLGKSKGKLLTTAQRWKAKRQKTDGRGDGASEEAEKAEQDKKVMLRLTEIADALVQDGMMEVYDASREKITVLLKQEQEKSGKASSSVPENVDADDALDMFAENFDKQEAEKLAKKSEDDEKKTDSNAETTISTEQTGTAEDDEAKWEYKWENTDTATIQGPHSTTQMMKWQEEGYFKDGAFCRRVGSGSQFYSTARIDFDLYT